MRTPYLVVIFALVAAGLAAQFVTAKKSVPLVASTLNVMEHR
jgi:hypothetical protein